MGQVAKTTEHVCGILTKRASLRINRKVKKIFKRFQGTIKEHIFPRLVKEK